MLQPHRRSLTVLPLALALLAGAALIFFDNPPRICPSSGRNVADGVVYFQPQSAEGMYARAPDGTLLWFAANVGGHSLTPAIGSDGGLYARYADPGPRNPDNGLWVFDD